MTKTKLSDEDLGNIILARYIVSAQQTRKKYHICVKRQKEIWDSVTKMKNFINRVESLECLKKDENLKKSSLKSPVKNPVGRPRKRELIAITC